jgi:hypothetical protein
MKLSKYTDSDFPGSHSIRISGWSLGPQTIGNRVADRPRGLGNRVAGRPSGLGEVGSRLLAAVSGPVAERAPRSGNAVEATFALLLLLLDFFTFIRKSSENLLPHPCENFHVFLSRKRKSTKCFLSSAMHKRLIHDDVCFL